MLRFGANRLGVIPNPYFHTISSLTWYILKDTQKSHGKTLRFIRNSESKREFFTKHSQVNFRLIKAFSGLDL